MKLDRYISAADLRKLILAARREDLGPRKDDITSRLLVPAKQAAVAEMRTRSPGFIAGLALLPAVAKAYGPRLKLKLTAKDGDAVTPGQAVARVSGPLRGVLAWERVALNFVTHLSGIASLTGQYVAAVKGTRAVICDTRKTHAGLRGLEKYAVACGGGTNHRIGLYDAVLVKDNHIAHLSLDQLPGALTAMIAKARRTRPRPGFIEIEVDRLEQLELVLPCGPDLVLLDNMPPAVLRQAVVMRDRLAPRVSLEASGGVNLNTVRAIAETGVDRISVGAITHSAPALDVGLDIS